MPPADIAFGSFADSPTSGGLPAMASPTRPAAAVGASTSATGGALAPPPAHVSSTLQPPQAQSIQSLLDGIAALKEQHPTTGEVAASNGSPGGPPPSAALDAPAAYAAGAAAGERAALLRAFREALPAREALGALAAAVRLLDAKAAEAAATSRSAGVAAAAALASASAAQAAVSNLADGPLRDLQAAARAGVAEKLSGQFEATLSALTAAVEAAHAPGGGLVRSARWAASAVTGLARSALDAADGAAYAASSRFLLDGRAREGGGHSAGGADAAARSRARALLGGALFLCAVELSWSAHKAAPLRTPRPLAGGLRRVRQASWAAALVLGLAAVREACFSAADAALGGVEKTMDGGEELPPPQPQVDGEEEEEVDDGPPAAAPAVSGAL